MTAQDFTLELFCRVDDVLLEATKHPLAALHPSEAVTLGMLQALRGEGQRAFYRWVQKELKSLFPRLPERTRLFRLLAQHAHQTRRFLAQPTFFGVCDSYAIELLHPRREGRSPAQLGTKTRNNGRWMVCVKVCVVCCATTKVKSWSSCGVVPVYMTAPSTA